MRYIDVDLKDLMRQLGEAWMLEGDDVEQDLAQMDAAKNTIWVWMCTRHNTILVPLTNVFTMNHYGYNAVKYYCENEDDTTKAFIIEQTSGGKGTLYSVHLAWLYEQTMNKSVSRFADGYEEKMRDNMKELKIEYRHLRKAMSLRPLIDQMGLTARKIRKVELKGA